MQVARFKFGIQVDRFLEQALYPIGVLVPSGGFP